MANLQELDLREYIVKSSEQIPAMYHYHERQEKAFYVISGTLHVNTPVKDYAVHSDDLFIVEAGHPHRAFNPADANGPIRVLAVGAPTDDPGQRYEP